MKIVVDAMGGDFAPKAPCQGALDAAVKYPEDEIILVGKQAEVESALKECGQTIPANLVVVPASEVIEMCDDPAMAVRRKKDSSMAVALNMLKEGKADAVVSAGSTGALLAGATLIVKRIKGIRRGAMAPIIPTATGNCVLIDCGANAECTPEFLLQFAYLGSFYAKSALKLEKPRVGLLNIGTEESKGRDLQKETYVLLKKAGEEGRLNFVGNVEAKEAMLGAVDVLVADGYAGNVMLKTIEGTAKLMSGYIKEMFKKNAVTKIAYLGVKGGVDDIKKKLDSNEVGGTAFIGLAKPVIKAHGSAAARGFMNAVRQARDCVTADLATEIENNIDFMRLDEGEISAENA